MLLFRYNINNPSKDRFLTPSTKNAVTITTTTQKDIFEWNTLSSNQVGNKCMQLNYFDFGIWFDYSGYLFETAFRDKSLWKDRIICVLEIMLNGMGIIYFNVLIEPSWACSVYFDNGIYYSKCF